jgi:phage-related protein
MEDTTFETQRMHHTTSSDERQFVIEAGEVDRFEPKRFARVSRSSPGSHGYASYVAQPAGKHRDAKTLSGFGGAGIMEVMKDFRRDTFRAVYTVRYAGAVYVLHAVQKISKPGRETPHRDIELIRRRLREAEQIANEGEQ